MWVWRLELFEKNDLCIIQKMVFIRKYVVLYSFFSFGRYAKMSD